MPTDHVSSVPVAARPFQGRRAGIITRCVAAAIDLLVVVLIVAAIYAGVAGFAFIINPSDFSWPDNLGWSVPVIGFVIVVPYLTLAWCTTGRTCGDALLGLRIVNYNGQRMRIWGAAARAVLCVIFPIGLIWVAFSPANRSVQDVLLRTSAIYDWTNHKPTSDETVSAAQNPEG